MWLRAFNLVSACVFSTITSSFSPADILHNAKPPSSTPTVLHVHVPFLLLIPASPSVTRGQTLGVARPALGSSLAPQGLGEGREVPHPSYSLEFWRTQAYWPFSLPSLRSHYLRWRGGPPTTRVVRGSEAMAERPGELRGLKRALATARLRSLRSGPNS